MNITWNAQKYTSDFSFVRKYGEGVMQLLDLPEGASVLDLGCGNGALSALLAEKGFRVTGMDSSPEQLAIAREKHPGIEFLQSDATDFTLPEPVDAVFANAVFHWIDPEKQPSMLRCIFSALKPGGQLVFEMGGSGNCGAIHAALSEEFQRRGLEYDPKKYFPTIGGYAPLLESAGFTVRYAVLFNRLTELTGDHGVADWIAMFERTALNCLPDESTRREAALAAESAVRDRLFRDGKWYADYVRLRMKAVKPL